jgi:hypothetical protein
MEGKRIFRSYFINGGFVKVNIQFNVRCFSRGVCALFVGFSGLLFSVDQASAASLDAYHDSLATGDSRASAMEAMRLMKELSVNGGVPAEEVMQTAEQLMTAVVASGDDRSVRWVSAGIIKGAGADHFNAAELGMRVVVEGSRYQAQIAQVVTDARVIMDLPAPTALVEAPMIADVPEAPVVETLPEDRSFFAELFNINRSSWSVSNRFAVKRDSNLYSNVTEESGFTYSDAISMSLSASSPRTAMQVFYKPTLTLSPDKEVGDQELYQTFVGMLSHELSERNLLRVSNSFSYRESETYSDTTTATDNSYWRNDFQVGLDRVMPEDARLSFTLGSGLKRYSDVDQQDSDYKTTTLGASYSKALNERTFASGDLSYMVQDYDNSDLGTTVISITGGINHEVNPDLVLSGKVGAQLVQPDLATSEDTMVPYFSGNVVYYFSPRTTLHSSLTRSYDEDSSLDAYVGSESLVMEVGLRHSFTERLLWSLKVGKTTKTYSVEYGDGSSEDETRYTDFDTRLVYKINRIHSVDTGYNFRSTEKDSGSDYDRHRLDFGWTVKF